MERFDVAVIGAGPAGSRAAWRLARAGARVAILDGSHPREKPCGGGVTGRALEMVRDALDGAALGEAVIRGASFENGSRAVRVTFEDTPSTHPDLVVASRALFDAALLSAARSAGARHIAARVTELAREAGEWRVVTRDCAVRTRWLLGADGANSLVRRKVSQPFARADLSIATGFYVRGVSSPDIAIAFETDPPGYLWSFPRRDHLAVGVCAQADESSTASLLPLASRWIARNVAGSSDLERYSWPIPSLREATARREVPAGPGWMLLGDAAGMVDPITREGIFFALLSADFAANCLLEPGTDPAVRYAARMRTTIYDELVRAARLKARFFSPRFTALLVRALQTSAGVRRVMIDLVAGRQPYRGLRRRLLATMELQLMIEMLLKE
jgi:geranylgeranyl reductase family protein